MLKSGIYQQPRAYPQSGLQTDFRSNVTVLMQEKPSRSFSTAWSVSGSKPATKQVTFFQKIEVSVPALPESSPWQQEIKLFLVCLILLPPIFAVCSKSHYQPRCNCHRKKQLCLGTKNFNANNKTVKSALPTFSPIF